MNEVEEKVVGHTPCTTDDADAMLTEAIAFKRKKGENVTVLSVALDEIRRLAKENAELKKAITTTRDGKAVGFGETVYTVFPGDRGATPLRVMSLQAQTQGFEHYPVHDCFSARAAAEAATRAGVE